MMVVEQKETRKERGKVIMIYNGNIGEFNLSAVTYYF